MYISIVASTYLVVHLIQHVFAYCMRLLHGDAADIMYKDCMKALAAMIICKMGLCPIDYILKISCLQ